MQCEFETLSEHLTSAGRVRYQRCRCGRIRVVVGDEVVARAAAP